MRDQILTRRSGGEYSTVRLPNGVIETMWFGDDGTTRMVSRTLPESLDSIAERHIRKDTPNA